MIKMVVSQRLLVRSVADGSQFLLCLVQDDRRMFHSQRREDFFLHEGRVTVATGALDHMVKYAIAKICVLVTFTREREQFSIATNRLV